MMRLGQGLDIHPLEPGRPLWIGGVLIQSDVGAVGDSDADVLLHAAMDACLGAAGAGDLGTVFPRRRVEPGTASRVLWAEVWAIFRGAGWRVESLDSTVVLEAPRLSPYRAAMVDTLGRLTGSPHVSVKFKTADGLGPVGERRAVSAQVVILAVR